MTLEGFALSPKSILEPTPILKWLGKLLVVDDGIDIFDLDGAPESELAKFLKFGVATCTRKNARSMLGKLSWLARPSPFILPLIAGAYAHTLWGLGYYKHALFASVLALAYVGWEPSS